MKGSNNSVDLSQAFALLIEQTIGASIENAIDQRLQPLIEKLELPDPLELLTTDQVISLFKISKMKLRSLVAEGAIKPIRLGQGKRAPLRYSRVSLTQFLIDVQL